MKEKAISLRNISMVFPGVKALDDVSFDVNTGELHTIIGENGAGKSTLIKILAGVIEPTAGEIEILGGTVRFHSPREAQKFGIGVVHQELSNFIDLDVMSNLLCGNIPRTGLTIDYKKAYAWAREILDEAGVPEIDERASMKDLSLGSQQMVEIARLLNHDVRIVIFDEPTSALTNEEVDHLFTLIDSLKKKGVTIIYISHRLGEVLHLADSFTVLKDGKHVITKSMDSTVTRDDLVKYMVGREVEYDFDVGSTPVGDILMEVEHLSHEDSVRDISFTVRSGEILGIAGLEGSGRTELLETLYGWRQPSRGSVKVKGKPVTVRSPLQMKKKGLAYITKERKNLGLFLGLDIQQNISAASTDKYQKKGIVDYQGISGNARKYIDAMNIRCSGPSQKVVNLSGGNQQKVLLSMWIASDPDILLIDEPTRGVDVGAKAEIHFLLRKIAGEGKAVIVISSELPEIMASCDRVLVMHEGKVTAELKNSELSEEKILRFASGH